MSLIDEFDCFIAFSSTISDIGPVQYLFEIDKF